MNSNQVQRRSANRRRTAKKNKTIFWSSLFGGLVIVAYVAFVYFQNHFFPTARINNLSVGWLSVEAAEKKLAQLNEASTVTIKIGDKEEKIELPKQYEISEAFLKKNLHKGNVKIPANAAFTEELKKKIAAMNFPEGTPSQNAQVQWGETSYVIVPEKTGTIVDKVRLSNQIIKDVAAGKGNYVYNVADFY